MLANPRYMLFKVSLRRFVALSKKATDSTTKGVDNASVKNTPGPSIHWLNPVNWREPNMSINRKVKLIKLLGEPKKAVKAKAHKTHIRIK
jgi:hypothetical protein